MENLISIIMPTFKRGAALGTAIESVIRQDLTGTGIDWELLVVGDCCPYLQKTLPGFCYEYGDPRIRWINLEKNFKDSGITPRNRGIALARGALIAYLDDDNTWESNHLKSLYVALIEKQAAYAFSSFTMRVVQNPAEVYPIICRKPVKYRIDTSAILHRVELISKYGPWTDKEKIAHDWELVSRWSSEKLAATELLTVNYAADATRANARLIYEHYGDQTPLK